jgi:hypothetical protein
MAKIRVMVSSALRLVAVLGVALATLTSAAQGRTAAPLSLNVNFALSGAITVTLPNGTPVGSTSGSPTLIPAGFYIVDMNGPGGCAAMPHFTLRGPGVQIFDNLNEGESDHVEYNANLMPNSTYVWSSDAAPGVVHTFATSSDVVGTAPPRPANGLSSNNHTTVKSTDFIGSEILPFRGTITAAVSTAGKLSLAYKGKSIGRLNAGRYTIAVTDKSTMSGFTLQKLRHAATPLTGRAFVGKRSSKVELTAGKWFFTPTGGKQAYTIAVVAAL